MNVLTREELLARCCIEKQNIRGTIYFENTEENIVAKVCSKCSEIMIISNFYKSKDGLGNCTSMCISCNSEYKRKRYEADPEKYRKIGREFHKNNRDSVLVRQRRDYDENKERYAAYYRKWGAANSEMTCLRSSRRRTLKALLPYDFSLNQQEEIVDYFNGGCALTGSIEYQMDHVLPIKCGHGGTTSMNMIPLRADLNSSKNASHIFEWFSANQERFGIPQSKFDILIEYLAEVNGMNVKEYRAYVDWCFDNPRNSDTIV